ncbi:hypothetical protein, partial [Mesorhizobium sp. M4A.F.Ca.ET.022.05.2.1]|uniref:hypothetical protein n=1 Tax=Mesorhizobium sp. M4A.F.Ca.ET.022.05.2.1 TaxID=2496653 RepID=UPI001AECCBC0
SGRCRFAASRVCLLSAGFLDGILAGICKAEEVARTSFAVVIQGEARSEATRPDPEIHAVTCERCGEAEF